MAANIERMVLRTIRTYSRTPSRWKSNPVELQCRRNISFTAVLRRDKHVSPQEQERERLVMQDLVELMKMRDGDDKHAAAEAEDNEDEADIADVESDPRIDAYSDLIEGKFEKGQDPLFFEDVNDEPDRPHELGYWAEGEPDQGRDDDFFGDDISSIGHTELETHREMREYARLAAWELPLLSRLAQPFQLPSDKQPLRFRYTTYLGEEHPAAHKVVLEFAPLDLPKMSQAHVDTLIKLCGPRYNPEKQVVKMSCEQFDTQMQNKRWLLDTVNALIKEAKDGRDSFKDVPFDFRHYKSKTHYEFPREWVMTGERRAQLEAKRAAALQIEQQLVASGKLLDGKKIVEQALSPGGEEVLRESVMIEAPTWYKGRRRFRRP